MKKPPDVYYIDLKDESLQGFKDLMDYAFVHGLEYLYERAKQEILNRIK